MVKADEAFYLTIPRRLLAGDMLLAHEWHPSQLVSLILLPLVKFHDLIFSSNEGLIIHFRYLYLLLNTFVAITIYIKLNSFSYLGAALASISYYIFTPWSIMTLSYNTLGLMLFILCSLFLLNKNKSNLIFSGLFFALEVLCNPYMIILFILYSILVFLT